MRELQAIFAQPGFERYRKATRREQFLAEMERIVPWAELCEVIEPHYSKVDGAGRPPVGLDRMLRIYFLQQWFNLSDPAVEEAVYDSASIRAFVEIDLGREPAPDETTVCKFRHLLEKHTLGEKLFQAVNAHFQKHGLKVTRGTTVDATIIGVPTSTNNHDGKRDPEMCQTKKGNRYYFGMKAHIGVDCIKPSLSIPSSPPRPIPMTRRPCLTCCMGMRPGFGMTVPVAVRPKRFGRQLRMRRTSRITRVAAIVPSPRLTENGTAPNPKSVPKWNICSG